jgi:putative colanic acid biosynthesis acetyltransferase WcaF
MGAESCLAPGVECYNVDVVHLAAGAIVSQRAHLCTASHDFNDADFPLVAAPIRVEEKAWVCAEAFVGPGVTVHEGAVVGARAVVTKNVPAGAIVVGNPARLLNKKRMI